MRRSGDFITSGRFVFNNIEHINNETLKHLLAEPGEENKSKISLTRNPPEKRINITKYIRARIAKYFVKGCSLEKVMEIFPEYNRHQLKAVRREVEKERKGK